MIVGAGFTLRVILKFFIERISEHINKTEIWEQK